MRRILKAIGVLLLLAVCVAGYLWWQVKKAPAWYNPKAPISEEIARNGEDKMVGLRNWAAQARPAPASATAPTQPVMAAVNSAANSAPSASQVASHTQAKPDTANDPPADRFVLKITQPEFSTLLRKWYEASRQFSFLEDPDATIQQGVIIVAGKLPRRNVVISLHFSPELDNNGQLRIKLLNLQAGNVSVPGMVLDKSRAELMERLENSLRMNVRLAHLESSGLVNRQFAEATMLRMALSSLKDLTTDPVAVVPATGKDGHRPLELTQVHVDGDTLILEARPLPLDSAKALLAKLQGEYGPK